MTGYLRQDDDGHWFLVPVSEIDAFREALELVYTGYEPIEVVSDFNERFGKYRLYGMYDSIFTLQE